MGSIDHLQQKHQTALNTPTEFNMEPENDPFQKGCFFSSFFLQLPGIQFQGCHSDIISFLAFAQVDRSSGSHEARRVSELRSELWGVLFRWSGANGRLGGSRVRFVFCSNSLDHSQNENVNIGLHEMAQMVWKSMVLYFCIVFFCFVLGAFGKFLGTQVIGSKFKWTTQKLVNFNSFSSRPSSSIQCFGEWCVTLETYYRMARNYI